MADLSYHVVRYKSTRNYFDRCTTLRQQYDSELRCPVSSCHSVSNVERAALRQIQERIALSEGQLKAEFALLDKDNSGVILQPFPGSNEFRSCDTRGMVLGADQNFEPTANAVASHN